MKPKEERKEPEELAEGGQIEALVINSKPVKEEKFDTLLREIKSNY